METNPPITLDLDNFQFSKDSWRVPVDGAMDDPFFFKSALHWGQEETLFLTSATDLDDDTDWRPVRPLGKGGYGIVGLWQKTDSDWTVLDSLAIKQQKYRNGKSQEELMASSGIAYEAALMYQLNEQHCPNIIQLRGFKDHPLDRLWRFYFEFAEWGDLRRLEVHYRAWNTYLPEEFLWQVFHGLATAALALRIGEFYEVGETSGPLTDDYIVHFDLKPENIVLGDPDGDSPLQFSNYPVAKMADFGLARFTNHLDLRNPGWYRGLGTPGYIPPEQLGQTAHWKVRPEGKDRRGEAPPQLKGQHRRTWCQRQEMRDPTPGYHFDATHNTYCVGKIMFELLTLRGSDGTGREIESLTEDQYWNKFERNAIEEIRTTRQPEYSDELRDLVRSCLRTAPTTRPTHGDLWRTTFRELESRIQAVEDPVTGLKNGPRVFYMGHEINDMPIGQQDLPSDQAIPFTKESYYAHRELRYHDPDLESLLGGRWDPRLQRRGGEIPPPIRGGRKRTWEPKAYTFMPDRDDSERVAKRVRSAQRFYEEDEDEEDESEDEEDDGDGDGDDGDDDRGNRSHSHTDQGMRAGPPRGGGKTRGGSGGRAGIQGMGQGGKTTGGKSRSRETGGEESDRTSRGGRSTRSSKGGKNADSGRTNSTPSQPSKKDSLDLSRNRGLHTQPRLPSRSPPPEQGSSGQPPSLNASQASDGKPGEERPPTDPPTRSSPPGPAPSKSSPLGSSPPRSQTPPSSQVQKGKSSVAQRGRGRGGTERARGSGARGRGRGRGRGAGRQVQRGADQLIMQQALPAIEAREVGGRALRPRR